MRPPRANLPPQVSAGELQRCRFHPERQPLCPILRLGDVARFAGQDFTSLAATVSWGCKGCGMWGMRTRGCGMRGWGMWG